LNVVLQRVSRASVRVHGEVVGSIERGLLLLVGVADGDTRDVVSRIARKCAEMRIFGDDAGRFDLSLLDIGGEALVVSQFTLLGDVRRGRRPSFAGAAPPEVAAPIVDAFADALRDLGVTVAMGRFGATMDVELVNDGPVTIVMGSSDLARPRRN
jgi:D-tyrosyl-tRNA(Tyr) deacylase